MQKIFVFVLTLQLICCSGILAEHEEELPIASHFEPSQLANLSLKEEHELQLKALNSKNGTLIKLHIVSLELYAKFYGNDFYSLIDNETVNSKTTAIFKAVADCLGKVQIQSRVYSVFFDVFRHWIYEHLSTTHYEVSQALYNLSSEMDDKLKNESIYTTLRDEYIKSVSWKGRKIYLYGIPKTEEELRIAIAQLMNDPDLKKLQVNLIYTKPMYPETERAFLKGLVSYMANFPGKLEAVQKMYDETILEVVSNIPDFPANKIDPKVTIDLDEYQVGPSIIFDKLREKIATLIRTSKVQNY